MVEENQANGIDKQYNVDFENCRIQHFLNVGFNESIDVKTKSLYRLCPKHNEVYKKFMVKNSYTNTQNRYYFSINLRKCSTLIDKNCESEIKIGKFLNSVIFT